MLDIGFLTDTFFFLWAFWTCCPTASWLPLFLLRSQLLILLGFPDKWQVVFFSHLFQDFLILLIFQIFNMIHLFVDLLHGYLELNKLPGGVILLSKSRNFLPIIAANTFSAPFLLSSPSGFPIMHKCAYVPHIFVRCPTFLWGSVHSSSFVFLCSLDCKISSNLLTFSTVSSILLLSLLVNFLFQVYWFNSRSSSWFFFFIISISLLILSIWYNITIPSLLL